jgi:hypothetical protein
MLAPTSTRLSFLAMASAILGLLCVTGPLAMLVGWIALRAINHSDGRLRGAALAVTGLVTGGITLALLVLGSLAVVMITLRERSNRVECVNNLGQIGLAVTVDSDQAGHTFPSAVLPLPAHSPEEHLSWLAGILPVLEQRQDSPSPWQPLFSRLDHDRPWNDSVNRPATQTNVRRFLCRTHPHFDPRAAPGLTHYVGIAGIGINAASLSANDPAAGFFGYDRIIGPADVTAGASCTLLAAETTADNGPWAAGGPPTVRGVDPDATRYIGPGQAFGGCHRDGAIDVLTAAYADASVRIVTSEVNPRVFRNSARLAGDPDAK